MKNTSWKNEVFYILISVISVSCLFGFTMKDSYNTQSGYYFYLFGIFLPVIVGIVMLYVKSIEVRD